ncbi:MAG: Ig-like domain-containing protein [Bacteroidales bacterium]|nr:Ig-like domain-containing protein [Bacteroidales bacterium]
MGKGYSKSFIKLLFPLFLALPFPFTLMNCARESAPIGGPVDTIVPYAVFEKPENNSQNINPQKIVVKFNEFIALDNVDDNCMISPVLDEKPTISVKKKKMTIDLSKQKLQPNTTYSFNFNNAIKDLTEGNVTEQYLYAFSTGSGIDSMKIAGKVSLAKDEKISEHMYVLLYDNLSDTAFQTQKPRYITQVSKKGDFSFSNIEAKQYRIYALEDSDKDFMFNQVSEKIAFLDTIFNPTAERYIDSIWYSHNDTIRFEEFEDSIQIVQVKDSFNLVEKTRWSDQNIKLTLFENEVWNQAILTQKRISKYAVAYKFAAKDNFPTNIEITPKGEFKQEILNSDSLIVWLTDTSLQSCDSLQVILTYQKNLEDKQSIVDTTSIELAKDLPDRLSVKTNLEKSDKVYSGDSITIVLSRPLKDADLSKISLYESCDTSKNNCEEIIPFSDNEYRPKKHYNEQTILKYKEANDRFALYFSKKIQPEDVTVVLDGLPNLQDWYYCELDKKSNALLFWIKPDSDALKLKNQAITVKYKTLSEKDTVQNFNQKKDVDVQKMYKVPFTNKKLILQLAEEQKTLLKPSEPLLIYCNNPIKSVTDSLFSLVNNEDSLETSVITRVALSKASSRIIEVYHDTKPGESYSLTVQKNAIVDTFGSQNREFIKDIQTASSETLYVQKIPYSIVASNNERTYSLIADWKTNFTYKLIISDSTFTDIFGDANDSIVFSFQCPKKDDVGSFLVKNTQGFPSENLIFILEAQDNKKEETYIGSKTSEGIRFENIPAGSYNLSCVDDENANNRWDSGCFEIKRQPEKIYNYKEAIIIKPEWENSVFWEEFLEK